MNIERSPRPHRVIALWAIVVGVGACSSKLPSHCGDAGMQHHDDTVTVSRGDSNGTDFDLCAAGNCYPLCSDTRGRPGNGSRVTISMCERLSVDGGDAGTMVSTEAGQNQADAKADSDGPPASSLSLRIVYDVFPCPSGV